MQNTFISPKNEPNALEITIDGISMSLEEAFIVAASKCQSGDIEGGKRVYNLISKVSPTNARAIHALGFIASHLGNTDEAVVLMKKAIVLRPKYFDAHSNLGNIFFRIGKLEEALECFRAAVSLDPQNPLAHANLGIALRNNGQLQQAEEHHRIAVALDPQNSQNRSLLASVLQQQCKQEEAVQEYKASVQIQPHPETHSDLLLVMNYLPSVSIKDMYEASKAWDNKYGNMYLELRAPFKNVPDEKRPLRIGYVSADFCRHPVGFFLLPVLAAHNDHSIQIYCYSGVKTEDDFTSSMRRNANEWRSTVDVSDADLIAMIRADGIDILIDLSGHTKGNRLPVFTARPAPVQMTWAGYVGTTGLAEMDYLISDWHETPEGTDKWYVEKVERLPQCYVCYEPPSYAPAVGPLPALRNGYVTFGCFNNITKINIEVVRLWAKILRQIPGSRFVMGGSSSLDDPNMQAGCSKMFREAGFDGDIQFFGKQSHPELLALYNNVDISLDPFPYSGGLTTLESLWMGVPVITQGGGRFCSRHSLSHLTTVGVPEFIATSQEEYLNIAFSMAHDLRRLETVRKKLRQSMAQSPICDSTSFTLNLEDLYRRVWAHWCVHRAKVVDGQASNSW